MTTRDFRHRVAFVAAMVSICALGRSAAVAAAPTVAQQWNQIAENAVIDMAYVSAAVHDAVTSIEGKYRPLHRRIDAPNAASWRVTALA
jgi:hypothetical protein